MSLSVYPVRPVAVFSLLALGTILCVASPASQKTGVPPDSPPKYDSQTETKINGVVEEVNLLTLGMRKDFTELIVKVGDDRVRIYACPKAFQEEVGISLTKGDQITVTGSKVKLGTSDVVLARELVKGSDTFQFRDGKGKPVWDERTGK